MAASRAQREARRRKQRGLLRQARPARSRPWIFFLRVGYAILFALVSWTASLLVLKPKVKVEVKNSPMPVPAFQIQISNDSTFSIYNVRTSVNRNGIIGQLVIKREHIIVEPERIEEIEAGAQPASFVANVVGGMPESPSDRMDVFVTTSFRASFMWWSTAIRKHFAARRLSDGSIMWYEDPSLDITLPDYPKSKFLEESREQESKAK